MFALIVYSMLSGLCVLIAVTGLQEKHFPIKINLLIFCYITVMAAIVNCFSNQSMGIFVICLLLLLIYGLAEENRIQSVLLASIGYLMNVFFNNVALYLLDSIFGISAEMIQNNYYIVFSLGYAATLKGILKLFYMIIYKKVRVTDVIRQMPQSTQRSIVTNLVLYVIIFIVMISLGEQTGYSTKALQFNCILFLICMIVNVKLILECTRGIESVERKKANEQQYKNLKNYVENLEKMIDEMRAFRHDYKNILSTMAGYLYENRVEELKDYFQEKVQITSIEGEKTDRGVEISEKSTVYGIKRASV